MEVFYHLIGYFIMWLVGMIVFPFTFMIIAGIYYDWDDEVGCLASIVGFIVYWFATALFLILK